MGWSKRMKKKLRSSRGMTLTELLVALMIVSLIGVSLTVGVNGAAQVYRDSTRLYEAETLCGTILTYLEDEFRFARNVRASGGEVYFDSQTFGPDVKVIVDTAEDAGASAEEKKNKGKVFIGKDASSVGALSAKLLSDEAYTSGLKVVESSCTVGAAGQVTITIAVGSAESGIYAKHTVEVTPVDR